METLRKTLPCTRRLPPQSGVQNGKGGNRSTILSGTGTGTPGSSRPTKALLQFDLGAGFFELFLELLGIVL